MMAMGDVPQSPTTQRRGYEFTDAENGRIDVTAKFARWWGGISIGGGALVVAMGGLFVLLAGASSLIPTGAMGKAELGVAMGAAAITVLPLGLVYLACGFFYLGAGADLRR